MNEGTVARKNPWRQLEAERGTKLRSERRNEAGGVKGRGKRLGRDDGRDRSKGPFSPSFCVLRSETMRRNNASETGIIGARPRDITIRRPLAPCRPPFFIAHFRSKSLRSVASPSAGRNFRAPLAAVYRKCALTCSQHVRGRHEPWTLTFRRRIGKLFTGGLKGFCLKLVS